MLTIGILASTPGTELLNSFFVDSHECVRKSGQEEVPQASMNNKTVQEARIMEQVNDDQAQTVTVSETTTSESDEMNERVETCEIVDTPDKSDTLLKTRDCDAEDKYPTTTSDSHNITEDTNDTLPDSNARSLQQNFVLSSSHTSSEHELPVDTNSKKEKSDSLYPLRIELMKLKLEKDKNIDDDA